MPEGSKDRFQAQRLIIIADPVLEKVAKNV